MLSSISTFQSLNNKCGKVTITPSVSLSNGSGTNVTYNLNYTNNIGGTNYSYTKTGYKVYFINNTVTPSNSATGNVSGSFTLTVTGATTTVYYAVCASGAGGGTGGTAGGGASSGELKYGSISLPVGTYSCSHTIGNGGFGSGFVASGNYASGGGTNGYGYDGRSSTLTINGTTITANKGCPGASGGYGNNLASGFVLGSGSGATTAGAFTGSTGSNGFNGGSTPSSACSSGGSGASNVANGNAGNSKDSRGTFAIGVLGGTPSNSSTFPVGLQFNQTCYFAEGGQSACARNANLGTIYSNPYSGYYLAGQGASVNGTSGANYNAGNSILGSGGSGGCFSQGGWGGNGFILLSF